MEEFLSPRFTPLFVLLTCLVFAWIGYTRHDDGDPPPFK